MLLPLHPSIVINLAVTTFFHYRPCRGHPLLTISSEAIPQRPPFKNLECDEGSIAAMQCFQDMALESQALKILKSGHAITSISCDFNRLVSWLIANLIERDTFPIDTADKNVPKWKAATLEIRAFLEAHSTFKNVAVET